MNKVFIIIFLLLLPNLSKGQKFGYVNSDFILKNMQEYKEAISEIDLLSKAWKKKLAICI